MTMKILTLIDGNSLMFRAFYATAYTGRLMQNKKGLYTNAIYGFVAMFEKLMSEGMDHAFVAFDAGKQTFRHQEYADYKAGRRKMPEEFAMQIPVIKQYLDLRKIAHFETLEFEADDLIASASALAGSEYDEIRIVTGDKDLLQLVGGRVKVELTKKGIGELEEYNEENFHEKTGLTPAQVTDYKGIAGDHSDHLLGIVGVGEKTALKLLETYGSLEGILAHADLLKGKTKELFIAQQDQALMCKRLATLRRDALASLDTFTLAIGTPDRQAILDFYGEMGFVSIAARFARDHARAEAPVVATPEAEDAFAEEEEEFGTSWSVFPLIVGANEYESPLLGVSIGNAQEVVYLSLSSLKENPRILQGLSDPQIPKITHDAKSALVALARVGIRLAGITEDTLLSSYLINPAFASANVKETADHFGFAFKASPFDEEFSKAQAKGKTTDADTASYATDIARRLPSFARFLKERIQAEKAGELYELEMTLSHVLAKMEFTGLKIDRARLAEIGRDLTAKAKEREQEVYRLAGHEFNVASPKQLGTVLFEEMNLPHGKKNRSGYSTNVEVLQKLAPSVPIVAAVLEYRTYNKLVATYVDGISSFADPLDFIHPLYKQALTTTGRLSSFDPNIQNMPTRTEEGQVIREIFVSRFPGGVILDADYSQIELRLLAHLSGDAKMIEAFNSGEDFHCLTASEVFGVPLEAVTKEQRRKAKIVNFGVIYGISAWGLSDRLGMSALEANIFINRYFATYPTAKAYLDSLIAVAKEKGYSETILGRRRYLPELASSNAALRSFGERTAMNTPIQGSAADFIKVAMNKVQALLEARGFHSVMIAQVHDELVFDCPADEADTLLPLVKETMENAIPLRVKMQAECAIGRNWLEAK